MHMHRHILLVPLLTVALAGCGQSTGGASSTRQPPAGAITGRLVTFHSQDRHHTRPLARVRVAVYDRAFPVVGPIMVDGPRAIAHTVSASDGTFVLRGLRPGRYFVVAQSTARWVELRPWSGARVTIAVCGDCPLPL